MHFIQDLTVGKPMKLLIQFSLPMLLGNLFQQLYTMADSIIVGKFVGSNALASVGACGSIIYFFFSLCFGIATGIGIIISQHFGAKKNDTVRRTIANSCYLILGSSLFLTIPGILLARPVLILLQTPPTILEDAVLYFQITSGGILAVAFYNGIASVLRALGDSKTPLFFLIFAALLNIGLDLLFVLVFHMGVAGAAAATILAQLVSAVGCLIFAVKTNPYFLMKRSDFAVSPSLLREMMHIGLPVALQNAMISLSCVFLQGVINSFGEKVVAAFTATGRIENLVHQPFLSLNAALSSYTAQNLGAGKIKRVKQGTTCSVILVSVFSILMVLVMHLFGRTFMHWFVTDEDVVNIGAHALNLICWFFIAWGLLYVFRSVLNGSGDARFAFFSGLLEIAGRMGLAIFFTSLSSIGLWGIWLAEGSTWFCVALAGAVCYLSGRWMKNYLTPL